MPPGDVAVIIPAWNEASRIGATVHAASTLTGVDLVVVVDDGSFDETADIAAQAGASVVRHTHNRGKAAAMETGAEAVRLIESVPGEQASTGREPRHLLFLDADLADSAAGAGPLIEPIRAGTADLAIAVFASRVRKGGFGIVVATSAVGTARAIGWHPAQPLAARWGAETAMTIDLALQGMRITEVEVPLSHRATGNDWRSQLHRLRQLADVTRALAVREPGVQRLRAVARSRGGRQGGTPGMGS
jgi:glycosyltransferase involved in cell wall biosynthesis